MRSGQVYHNGQLAGLLIEHTPSHYEFRYEESWFNNTNLPAISLTLPKTKRVYQSDYLFPFFFNMLSEGVNRKLQCRQLKISEKDDFGLLLATAHDDTIGAVTVRPINIKKQ